MQNKDNRLIFEAYADLDKSKTTDLPIDVIYSTSYSGENKRCKVRLHKTFAHDLISFGVVKPVNGYYITNIYYNKLHYSVFSINRSEVSDKYYLWGGGIYVFDDYGLKIVYQGIKQLMKELAEAKKSLENNHGLDLNI